MDFSLDEIYPSKKGQLLKPNITSIAAGSQNMTCVSSSFQVFIWGERMGVYPPLEVIHGMGELNQEKPRLLQDNLLHYKPVKAVAGMYAQALITEGGKEILVRGSNSNG